MSSSNDKNLYLKSIENNYNKPLDALNIESNENLIFEKKE